MKKWLMAVLFGTLLVLGACGGGNDTDNAADDAADTEEEVTDGATDDATDDAGEADEGEADEGGTVDTATAEALYKDSCASCHGADLSGGAFPDLSSIGSKMSADEIEQIILDGKGSMPAGLLTGDDAKVVAEWLAEQK